MLTIFSVPKAFEGHIDTIQRNAIKSWTLLDPNVEVILFGEDAGVRKAASELGVRHEPQVNCNEYGTPLLDSVFDSVQDVARHNVLCYVNCDILLSRDFREAVTRVAAWRDRFLMAGRRWDIDITEAVDFSRSDWQEELRNLVLRTDRQRPPCWIDYFVFPRGQYYHEIPAFAVGRPGWDQWLIWHTRRIKIPVVDASRSVIAVHQNHDYSHHPHGYEGVWQGEEAKRNAQILGDSHHLFTTEHAQYRLEEGSTRWKPRYLWVELKPHLVRRFWTAWFAVLGVTRPLRHALGLRKSNAEGGRALAAKADPP